MKKIIFILILICLIVFLIYKKNIDNKIYYFNIMDNKYNFETYDKLLNKSIKNIEKYVNYCESDLRIIDLINNINDNITINKKNIQNILIKSDLITISIGNNELNYKLNNNDITYIYDYIDELVKDIKKLIQLIRKYSKERIYFIGYYIDNENYFEVINYLNERIKDICIKNNIVFISVNNNFDKIENVNIYTEIIKKY